jgi:starch synthase (maltosyl-transferring)
MRYLAKAGFSQSHTYFTWRNTARESQDRLTSHAQRSCAIHAAESCQHTRHPARVLQTGGRPAFEVRLISPPFAATNLQRLRAV